MSRKPSYIPQDAVLAAFAQKVAGWESTDQWVGFREGTRSNRSGVLVGVPPANSDRRWLVVPRSGGGGIGRHGCDMVFACVYRSFAARVGGLVYLAVSDPYFDWSPSGRFVSETMPFYLQVNLADPQVTCGGYDRCRRCSIMNLRSTSMVQAFPLSV